MTEALSWPQGAYPPSSLFRSAVVKSFVAFLLIKTLWVGGAWNDADGTVIDQPHAVVAVSVETNATTCNADGAKWYAAAIASAAHGDVDTLAPNAITYDCFMAALGGESA